MLSIASTVQKVLAVRPPLKRRPAGKEQAPSRTNKEQDIHNSELVPFPAPFNLSGSSPPTTYDIPATRIWQVVGGRWEGRLFPIYGKPTYQLAHALPHLRPTTYHLPFTTYLGRGVSLTRKGLPRGLNLSRLPRRRGVVKRQCVHMSSPGVFQLTH